MDAHTPPRHALAALAGAVLLAAWWGAGWFGHEVLAEIAVFAILAMSLDLAAGYAGLVSLGHGALFGAGAYLYASATLHWGWNPSVAMPAAVLGAAGAAFAAALAATRVSGVYFIMITLALGEMAHELVFHDRDLGGDDGLGGIPRLDLSAVGLDLGDPALFSLAALALAALVYLLVARVLAAPWGALLAGLHDNPARLEALGVNVRRHQIGVLTLSGAVAGLAGSLGAQHTQYISPQMLHWTTSGEVLVMVILGGLGTLAGPVIGAAVLVTLRHELADVTRYWGLWLGLFLVLVVMGGRGGIAGWLTAGWRRLAGPAGRGS